MHRIFLSLAILAALFAAPARAQDAFSPAERDEIKRVLIEALRQPGGPGRARAIELGYEKAVSAIIDANITTFITAMILFFLGSGPVKGFAVTLVVGLVTSVFTAIWVTRVLVVAWFDRKRPKTITV